MSDMTILSTIDDAMEDARNGKLSPYWQNDLNRECRCQKLSDGEQQALSELNHILSETPQWSSEEELRHNMENIGGRVWFCHFWDDHYSMVQLTEDRNGKYSTAYVLDTATTKTAMNNTKDRKRAESQSAVPMESDIGEITRED